MINESLTGDETSFWRISEHNFNVFKHPKGSSGYHSVLNPLNGIALRLKLNEVELLPRASHD